MCDLLRATRAELASMGLRIGRAPQPQGPSPGKSRPTAPELRELVARIDRRLARYGRRRDLEQSVATQRFAIYRALNGCFPGRAGRGWWHDLRPSALVIAPGRGGRRAAL